MFGRNKKTKDIDLLSIPDSERIKVTREIRRKLQEKVIERKLMRSFVEAETLTINGEDVFNADEPLKGFKLSARSKQAATSQATKRIFQSR